MTIEEIVINMMNGIPDYDKPMTLEDAKIDIENLRIDAQYNDEDLPEDLTPERYMEVWNSFCK